MNIKTFSILSLGCARNLVDSEVVAGSLKKMGLEMTPPDEGADLYVINTCAFIDSARRESVDAIVEAVRAKSKGKIGRLIVCGCLPQLYRKDISEGISEADLILGSSDFPKLTGYVKTFRKKDKTRTAISPHADYLYDESSPRSRLTPKHYAYVKISEGCSNLCSYCIISRLRGPFRSRTMQSVVKEVEKLSGDGALKEMNLIGQDTTLFGKDVYGISVFPELLRKICGIKNGIKWIRILYTHPAHYSDRLIAAIKDEPKICRYLDLPIQHISDRILKNMNRQTTKKDIISLIGKLRKEIPGIGLRTSVIVGFPGETDKDFRELLDFVRRTRFERLGAFIYSKEDGTAASRLKAQVPEKIKRERLDELMKTQQKISATLNRALVGKTLNVLIDEKCDVLNTNDERRTTSDEYYGRTEHDAPEIDCGVYVSGKNIRTGSFCKVKITGSLEYDLIGKAL